MVKKKVSKKKGIDNKNLILGMVVILLLVGVFLYFNNQKDVGLAPPKTIDFIKMFLGGTSSGNFIGSEVVIFSDSWNLIYGFPNPEWISGGDIYTLNIKAIYSFNPESQEYVRFYPNPELEKIKESNFRWDTYASTGAFFVLTDYPSLEEQEPAGNTGKMKYWTLEPAKLNDIQLLSGWNLIGVTSNFEGESINRIKGDCDILRIYAFQNNKWVDLEEGKDDFSLLYAFDRTKNIGLAIKVARDCNFESPEEMVGPPSLPGENEIASAKYNVETMNKKVEGEINKLFVEDQKVVLYLPNRVAEIKQGKKFGMAFGIQNVVKEQKFRWEIKVNDPDISRKCGVREQEAERWITNGRVGRVEIASGQIYYNLATFNIPEGSVSDISTCIIRYELVIREEDGGVYQVEFFDVKPSLPEDKLIKVLSVEHYGFFEVEDYLPIQDSNEIIFKISPFQESSDIKSKTVNIDGNDIFIEALEAYEDDPSYNKQICSKDGSFCNNPNDWMIVSINGENIEIAREEIKTIEFENGLVVYFIAPDIDDEGGSDVIIGKFNTK